MLLRACVAVKTTKETFSQGILKGNDRPLDTQMGAVTMLLDGEADVRYIVPAGCTQFIPAACAP